MIVDEKKKAGLSARSALLAMELTKLFVQRPELLDEIPQHAHIAILPDWDPELAEFNRELVREYLEAGEPVVYLRVGQLAPEPPSRLRDVRFEEIVEARTNGEASGE